jgi:hypothetical protein
MESRFVLALGILAIILLSGFSGSYIQKHSFSSLRVAQDLEYYKSTYLRKLGFLAGFGTYELLSFDGGKMWYAVERGKDNSIIIRGTAEAVFPGLLSHLEGIDALVEYAEKYGPLTLAGTLAGGNAETQKALLEGAGFTVLKTTGEKP